MHFKLAGASGSIQFPYYLPVMPEKESSNVE
jgi:hypothetical protein